MPNFTNKEMLAAEAYEATRSQRKAAERLGISRRSLRKLLDSYNAKLHNADPGFKITKVSKSFNAQGEQVSKSVVSKLAPDTTSDKREGKIIRRSTLYGADGEVTNEWIIRAQDNDVNVNEETVKAIIERLKDSIPREPVASKIDISHNRRMALINLVDMHMNMRAYVTECSVEWDIKTAYNVYLAVFEDLINAMPSADKIMLVNLGDMMDINDSSRLTPANKNLMDSDVPYHDTLAWTIQLNRELILLAKQKYHDVTYVTVRGNHDEDAATALHYVMQAVFENDENVNCVYGPSGICCEQFGENMLVFDHGDRAKPDQLAGYSAATYPSIYGSTKHRYIHTGHVHHQKSLDTLCGFLWRSHRTMSPMNKYATERRFHSPRSISGYIYDINHGEIFTTTFNI